MNTSPELVARDREAIGDAPNPLGLDGIEYIEYTTRQPQALGQVLENMGFQPVARHRSREVLLYRQGAMNVVINTHAGVLRPGHVDAATSGTGGGAPHISALALRVRDARAAFERALELGAWDVPHHAQVMELNIPGIHGPGGTHVYFVDRCQDFSIFDIDFKPIPGVERHPPSPAGLHWFGVVQYVGRDRTADWCEFWGRLMGFTRLPQDTRYGILPKGTLLQSPGEGASRFWLQLIEPDAAAAGEEAEQFHRIGFGTPDVPGAAATLQRRGVQFVESANLQVGTRGALTRNAMQSVAFELVQHDRG
jgi:4-hydroxyphenylpyruvate dioxygenase